MTAAISASRRRKARLDIAITPATTVTGRLWPSQSRCQQLDRRHDHERGGDGHVEP